MAFVLCTEQSWCNNDCNKKKKIYIYIYKNIYIYICLLKSWSFSVHIIYVSTTSHSFPEQFFSWVTQLGKQMRARKKKHLHTEASGSHFFLTCPKNSVSSTVSGTLFGWAASTESATGLMVTLGLPVTPVNTARTTMILGLIAVSQKNQMKRKRKRAPLLESAGSEMSQCGVM